MTAQRVRLDSVVVREDLYPRHDLSPANVTALRAKREAGITLDPVIAGRLPGMADSDPSIIVDGAHRRAVHEAMGDTWIMAEVNRYESEADLFADAARLNGQHGTNLTSYDRLKVLGVCERLGISEPQSADMLFMSVQQVQALKPRYAAMDDPEGGKAVRVPLKASVRHLNGRRISPTQASAIQGSAPGVSYLLITRQLLSALEHDLLPPSEDHPALWADLHKLKLLLP